MEQLRGRTAVITGAASGIGLAMAIRFGQAGMNVVLGDIEEPALSEALAAVQATGADAISQLVDVTKLAEVEALRDAALARFGSVHLVCNNAGIAGPFGKTAWELSDKDWQWVIGVDLWGPIHGVRVFTPLLIEQGEGHIVNTASLAGLTTGTVVPTSYHVAKHGVVALSECLFGDLAKRAPGVGVTVLCPGFVKTRINENNRNRPEDFAPILGAAEAPTAGQIREVMKELTAVNGLEPAQVADMVHDAVINRQFYIHTDPDAMPFIRDRHQAIVDVTNPPLGELG
jgi:NAD(P)-dependent dehydrogenase (short-subunit alcohol dehydrogenase family)